MRPQVAAAASTLRERCLARLHEEGLVSDPAEAATP